MSRSRGRRRRQKLGYKFRQCELQKVPYKIIVGDNRPRREQRTNLFVHCRAAAVGSA
ncbi:His/Gly/Thr/Pro-type tRNA ligase C-terminal domain-containing protein [Fibrobacter sp. UWEL]|uniref:His/Gly/Thr/Pro-type tRNA ligase C-terminal domain-containing protein n=1 Tax=Fibrobacter sp. UWEL TaxID=1896209 RepID=UPI001F3D93E8|nr:His/Gly/Thr/Pro-type tRNA ligase C-terminal domain-containing protein [Fibrobacter sp. UWEL]